MERTQKIEQLKTIIDSHLLPIIDNDFVLWDLPYYQNLGDVLIWNGTEEFLKRTGYKCLNRSSFRTWKYKELASDTIIILQGGGNFGDVWLEHQNFRKEIIKQYPNNKIIILPQTVYYKNQNILLEDANLFSAHKNLVICARDSKTYATLTTYFSNTILLLPDMAFFIPMKSYKNDSIKCLLLKRIDKEYNKSQENIIQLIKKKEKIIEIHDWPTYEKRILLYSFLYYSRIFLNQIDKVLNTRFSWKWEDFLQYHIIRKYCIKLGVDFLKPYGTIYSTRLHTAILSILMDKDLVFLNNSYGKNEQFYNTWLSDLSSIKYELE